MTCLADQVRQLLTLWIDSQDYAYQAVDGVPAHLLDKITIVEPWRRQAIEDARLLLSLPRQLGIGLEYHVEDELVPVAFGDWQETLQGVRLRISWSETMDSGASGMPNTDQNVVHTFERLVREDGEWRFAEIWDDKNRQEMLMWAEVLDPSRRQ